MGNLFGRSSRKQKRPGDFADMQGSDASIVNALEVRPMPPISELNELFEALLEDLNMPADKKEVMRTRPPEVKWQLCQQQRKQLDRARRNNTEQDYEQIVQALREGPSTELLSSLVVSLRSRPMRWISKFVEIQGLNSLLDYLKSMEESTKQHEHEELCIKCLKSLMNNKYGLGSVMAHGESVQVIALSLRSPLLRTRALVLEILGAVCLIPNGHHRVLDAMTAFTNITEERERFDTVVNCLTMELSAKSGGWIGNVRVSREEKVERILELKIAALSFINAVIFGGPGKELEYRVYMRDEFLRLGVGKIVDRLSKISHGFLETQVRVFQERLVSDEQELASRYDAAHIDKENPEAVFKYLLANVKNTQSFQPFTETFQTMLLVPAHPLRRPRYWFLFNELLKQILIQQNHEDPDYSHIKIDVASLISELADAEKLRESEDRAKKQADRAAKAAKELEAIKAAQEVEKKRYDEETDARIKRENELVDDLTKARADIDRLEMQLKEKADMVQNLERQLRERPVGEMPSVQTVAAPPPPPPPVFSHDPVPEAVAGRPAAPAPPPPPPPPGAPPPPPPPGMEGVVAVAGPGGKPLKRSKLSNKALRQFQWSKINNLEISKTVWEVVNDEEVHRRMDYGEFETLFAAMQSHRSVDRSMHSVGTKGSSENLAPTPTITGDRHKITVIAGRRAQTCNILLKSLKLTPEEVRRTIFHVDVRTFPPHLIMELIKLAPTTDEIASLQQYKDQPENMAAPERFFLAVSEIHRYNERLRAMYVRGMFDEWVDDAKTMVKGWAVACKELKTSKKFKELLKIVLALGNYLNSGNRGGAYGFRLESLLKLGEVKSTVENRKYTLLHYIADICESSLKDACNWTEEVKSAEMAAKVELPVLRQIMQAIRGGIKDVSMLLEHIEKDPKQTDDKFIQILGDWSRNAQKKYDLLDHAFKEAEKVYDEVCEMFAEDPKSTTVGEFFGRIALFAVQYNQAKADNELAVQKMEAEKKEMDRMQERSQLLKKNQVKKSTSHVEGSKTPVGIGATSKVPTGTSSGGQQKDGELDDIISAIKTGQAFFQQGGFQPQKRTKEKGDAPPPVEEPSAPSAPTEVVAAPPLPPPTMNKRHTLSRKRESLISPPNEGKSVFDRNSVYPQAPAEPH